MKAPPVFATWLLNHFTTGTKSESLIGDLIEEYQRGRSAAWYWRQVAAAVGWSFALQAWRQKWLAAGVVALAWLLPYVYVRVVWPWAVVLDQAWYPYLIDWLLAHDFDVVWRMTVRLHLWALTGTIVWCVLLAAVSWLLVRWLPGHRAVALTVFLLSNIAQCVPYMRVAFAEWVRDPRNPIWFLNVMWFATFALIATPASIICGGRVRAHS